MEHKTRGGLVVGIWDALYKRAAKEFRSAPWKDSRTIRTLGRGEI
jgi:hypothetical protein